MVLADRSCNGLNSSSCRRRPEALFNNRRLVIQFRLSSIVALPRSGRLRSGRFDRLPPLESLFFCWPKRKVTQRKWPQSHGSFAGGPYKNCRLRGSDLRDGFFPFCTASPRGGRATEGLKRGLAARRPASACVLALVCGSALGRDWSRWMYRSVGLSRPSALPQKAAQSDAHHFSLSPPGRGPGVRGGCSRKDSLVELWHLHLAFGSWLSGVPV